MELYWAILGWVTKQEFFQVKVSGFLKLSGLEKRGLNEIGQSLNKN